MRSPQAVVVARAGSRHLRELKAWSPGEENAESPKQFSAGLAENYLRVCTEERFSEPLASQLLTIAGTAPRPEGPAQRVQRVARPKRRTPASTTVDWIVSTHRVWLGTGGEPI